jgi:hypothetical protein
MHKINFEVASERATIKEHMLLTPNDNQVKHPQHLQQHEMLQVLQRYALNGDVVRTRVTLNFQKIYKRYIVMVGNGNTLYRMRMLMVHISQCN